MYINTVKNCSFGQIFVQSEKRKELVNELLSKRAQSNLAAKVIAVAGDRDNHVVVTDNDEVFVKGLFRSEKIKPETLSLSQKFTEAINKAFVSIK